jgi:MFS family permease
MSEIDATGRVPRTTFSSLRTRNYRLFYSGQVVSVAGTFMQTIAQGWLVVKLSGSAAALGWVTALQYLPLLLLGNAAGVVIDRVDRRRVFLYTQIVDAVVALALAGLVLAGVVQLWMVYLLALVWGIVFALENPLRYSLIYDLVGKDEIENATSLYLGLNNVSRVAGPALAGITIAVLGVGACFLVNSASYVAVIVAVLMIRASEMHPAVAVPRRARQIRDGLAYVRRTPQVMSLLLLGAIVFGLGWELEVTLPVFARFTFDGGPATYGLMTSAVGLGAVIGALVTARRARATDRTIVAIGLACSAGLFVTAVAPDMFVAYAALAYVGATAIAFGSICVSRLQLNVPGDMRGRVMAMWAIAVLGTRPVGAPVVGFVAEGLGPRYALGLSAAAVGAGVAVWHAYTRRAGRPLDAAVVVPVPTS